MAHAKFAKFAKFFKPPNTRNTRNHCAPRDHENCVGDESRRSAIESLSSACGITLRVASASVIASPLRVSSLAADTKRRERGDTKSHEMWGTGNWEEG